MKRPPSFPLGIPAYLAIIGRRELYPRCREGRADDVLSSAFVAAMHLPIRYILRETENDMSYGSGAEARL